MMALASIILQYSPMIRSLNLEYQYLQLMMISYPLLLSVKLGLQHPHPPTPPISLLLSSLR